MSAKTFFFHPRVSTSLNQYVSGSKTNLDSNLKELVSNLLKLALAVPV